MKRQIAVVGQGAWGRALAHVVGRAGHSVSLWSRGHDQGVAWQEMDAVILAVPAQAIREVASRIAPPLRAPLIIAAKGIERASRKFMTEVLAEVLPDNRCYVLSGPSFAADVLQDLPTAVTLAAPSLAEAGEWTQVLSLRHFRIYGSDDVVGVELGGALKNVLAIACGIAEGRDLGASARAALTTRGFAELQRLGRKLGARPETLMGLSGLGDLLLTCSTPQSRNYAFGLAIGRGAGIAQAHGLAPGVVEGAETAGVARTLARSLAVDMPIVEAVAAIVEDGASPDAEIAKLLARPASTE